VWVTIEFKHQNSPHDHMGLQRLLRRPLKKISLYVLIKIDVLRQVIIINGNTHYRLHQQKRNTKSLLTQTQKTDSFVVI